MAVIVAAVFLAAVSAQAQDAKLSLCGGKPGGIDHLAAQTIGQSLRTTGPQVRVVDTDGSLDNLDLMGRGECDAAIAPRDALMVYAMEDFALRMKIALPIDLYDELLHMVCRREAGIDDVGDLLRDPAGFTLLTGEPESASETTWRALTDLDKDYGEVGTRPLGGSDALAALAAGEAADCMITVAGPNAPFMTGVDAQGEALRLVTVDLFQFRDAEMVDNSIYRSAVIPNGTYQRLQEGIESPEVETIAVGATLVVARSWVEAHPAAYASLLRAVSDAKPAIRDRVQGRGED